MKRTTIPIIMVAFVFIFLIGLLLGRINSTSRSTVNAQQLPRAPETAQLIQGTQPPTDLPLPTSAATPLPTTIVKLQPTVDPRPASPDAKQLQQDLVSINWSFEPADASSFPPNSSITLQQALDIVKKQYPQFGQANGVVAHIGWLTNKSNSQAIQSGQSVDPTFATAHLVWIVTLSGVQSQSAGPPGSPHDTSNELNIVIDAKDGTYLMDFVWTR